MTNEFIALDVETANCDLSTICQLGIAEFDGGHTARVETFLVDPEDDFDQWNVEIHGIGPEDVLGHPSWAEIYPTLMSRLAARVVVSHGPFDRASVARACERFGFAIPEWTWLDSARVVRRTWTDLTRRGWGLANVAERLGIEFRHHDAGEDARVAGEVLLAAVHQTGISVSDWVTESLRRIGGHEGSKPIRSGNPDGPLYGESLAFTGSLLVPRREAADRASEAGCAVKDSVSKSTTILVVGDQDARRLVGHERSRKHRRAEELIAEGAAIRIVRESDFYSMIARRD